MKKNLYVVIEGTDGSGKSTVCDGIMKWLYCSDQKATMTREPGSPLIDLNVRDFVLSKKKLCPQALELLFEADRAEHTTRIKELIEEGYWVISDRSYISGMAYAKACGQPLSEIAKVMKYAVQQYPDVLVFLNLSPEDAAKRRQARGEEETREEVKGIEFMKKVYDNFLGMTATSWVTYETMQMPKKIVKVDASQSPDNVLQEVLDKLNNISDSL